MCIDTCMRVTLSMYITTLRHRCDPMMPGRVLHLRPRARATMLLLLLLMQWLLQWLLQLRLRVAYSQRMCATTRCPREPPHQPA